VTSAVILGAEALELEAEEEYHPRPAHRRQLRVVRHNGQAVHVGRVQGQGLDPRRRCTSGKHSNKGRVRG
jgi:hypothetical protein